MAVHRRYMCECRTKVMAYVHTVYTAYTCRRDLSRKHLLCVFATIAFASMPHQRPTLSLSLAHSVSAPCRSIYFTLPEIVSDAPHWETVHSRSKIGLRHIAPMPSAFLPFRSRPGEPAPTQTKRVPHGTAPIRPAGKAPTSEISITPEGKGWGGWECEQSAQDSRGCTCCQWSPHSQSHKRDLRSLLHNICHCKMLLQMPMERVPRTNHESKWLVAT
jgi:hypothetical protein